MKATHILSLVLLCMSGMAIVCAAVQWSGGVDRFTYTNTLGWSLIACGGSFMAWPHGYRKRMEEDALPQPPSLRARSRNEERKV